MKNKRIVQLISITMTVLLLLPTALAFFEYLGDRDVLIDVNGRINQNAFDVLNSDEYRLDQYGYGVTPENPFVINNINRLNNLIRLNNTGRLEKSKMENGVFKIDKYYFVLNFTEEDVPQVLNLLGQSIESVGNNEYPFVDTLSGLIYAYCYDEVEKKYIYLSGCVETVDVEVTGGTVKINGVETEVTGGSLESGKYIKVPDYYVQIQEGDTIRPVGSNNVYVPVSILRPIHNVIANANVKVPDDQIDVGFFSHIANDTLTMTGGSQVEIRGGVRDFILYNVTINATEPLLKSVWNSISNVWSSLFGGHKKQPEYSGNENGYYERHIGLFAGHIDGDVSNITIAGEGNIVIDTKDINYYTQFATAGYIDSGARIGTKSFAEIIGPGIGLTEDIGCFFADSIFAVADGGAMQYALKDIAASDDWSGVINDGGKLYFKQGAFRFILSDTNDKVRDIWNGNSTVKMLNEAGYVATTSVLYCNDEYRYSTGNQEGGTLSPSAASANETRYQGAHALVANGSMLDKGKYVIAAKVPDGAGGYKYRALKIIAEVVNGNEIVHVFDTSEKTDITAYINGTVSNIYSSAIWQTLVDSSKPKFRNDRFATEYLTVAVQTDGVTKSLTTVSADAVQFEYNAHDSAFYYKTVETAENGSTVTVYYYLCYNDTDGFYFSTEENTDILVYRLSNGFRIEPVDDAEKVIANEDYLIVAKNGDKHYLLGERIEERDDGVIVATGTFADDYMFSPMPTLWTLDQYQNFRQYIWYATAANVSGNTATLTLYDKISGRYYLSQNAEGLLLDSNPMQWTYTQLASGGTFQNGGNYINHTAGQSFGFGIGGSAFTLHLYRLVPEDDSSSYNTYQGARLITSESSSVEEGQYLLAADTGSAKIGLVMNGSGSWGTANITSYINGSGNMSDLISDSGSYAGMKWKVSKTSSAPSLKNVGFSDYLARNAQNNGVALSDSSTYWMYDAASGRLYYSIITGTGESATSTRYYLGYNGSTFVITEGAQTAGVNYNIRLYKITFQYVYSNVQPVQSITANDIISATNPKIYFLMTESLTALGSKATYVLGAKGTENESAVTSVNISPKSTFNSSTNQLTTTEDLAYYSWYLEPRILAGFPSDIYAATRTGSLFPAFQFKNSVTGMYLAASSAANSRTLVVATTPNMNTNPTTGSQTAENNNGAMTAIGFGQKNSNAGTTTGYNPDARLYHTDGTSSLYVMGRTRGYEYYIWKTTTPGVFGLSTYGEQPSTYSRPYLYQASGYTVNVLIDVLSEKGDNLDANIHHMITAKIIDSEGVTQYYALSEYIDENGQKRFKGINVTAQAETINQSKIYDDYGNVIEDSSTDTLRMVPTEADWIQVSTEKGLIFYHSFFSTNAVREYLTVTDTGSGLTPAYESIPVTEARLPERWYYDAISKYFKYYTEVGGTEVCYYLSYDKADNTFYLTTDVSEATNIYIYRFKPTYVVTQVTDASGEKLKNGNFIIVNKTNETYTAIGTNTTDVISKDVTAYVKALTGFRDDLSETEYNEILNFIFKQQFYDFSGETYDESSPYLQLFSYITGGGFTVDYNSPGLRTGSDPMVWTLAQNGSLWTFANRNANSNVPANERRIQFGGTKSYMKFADGVAQNLGGYVDEPLTVKLYRYQNSTLTTVSSINTSTSYNYSIVLTNSSNKYFIVNYTGGSFVIESLNVSVSGTTLTPASTLGTSYQFRATSSGGSYRLVSRAATAYITMSGGNFATGTSSNYNWTVNSSSNLLFSGSPATVYVSGTQHISLSETGSDVYLFRLESGTFARVTDDLIPGSTYALVMLDGSTYYLIGYAGTAFTRTSIGTSLPSTLTSAQVAASNRLTAYEGIDGVYLGYATPNLFINLTVENKFMLSGGKTTPLRYANSKLYTVSTALVPLEFILTSNGTAISWDGIVETGNIAETILYEAIPNAGGFSLSRLVSLDEAVGRDVVIILRYNNANYAINRNGSAINLAPVNTSLSNATANMVWQFDGKTLSYEDGGVKKYLRRTTSGLVIGTDKDIDHFEVSYVTYAFTAMNNTGTPLYILRIDQSSEVDEVTDLDSMLSSKAKLIPTISLLESSKYIIVAEINTDANPEPDKFYSLGMINTNLTQSMDITEMLKRAKSGRDISLFDAGVWEQRGNDIELVFDNCGFGGEDFYLLTGVRGFRNGMEPAVVHNEQFPTTDLGDYVWRTYTYADGTYLFGLTESTEEGDEIYYLYFDTNELKFKLTRSYVLAKNQNCIVQLYQLGEKTAIQPNFKTPIIVTEGEIIKSYPINKAEGVEDLRQYLESGPSSGDEMDANGEYLIIAQSGANYYALMLDENSILRYVDVSPYFSGNYSYDDDGHLCIAINYGYIWRQTKVIPSGVTNPQIAFKNMLNGANLGGGISFTYDFEQNTLSSVSGSTPYLTFSVANGFAFSAESELKIYLYQLGRSGVDTGDDGTLNYTYYSIPLSVDATSGVDFSRFQFNKRHISELLNFSVGANNLIEKSLGWRLNSSGEKLTEVKTSVFFTKGITLDLSEDDPAAVFKDEFVAQQSLFSVTDELTGDKKVGTFSYFSPQGTASFVISEASSIKPVFVNLIVTTEFDASILNPEYLRFLSLWKVGNLNFDAQEITPLNKYPGASSGRDKIDYAYTLAQKINTPDYAIPLPNRYGSAASKASYAKVDGTEYTLSTGGYEEILIAHTFVITSPGLYYLGTNYGSVGISYLSIDNMAEGETSSGISYGSQLTIDFCYGNINLADTYAFSAEQSDELLEDLCYVGSEGWYPSNIFPKFVSGNQNNLADKLRMNVYRTYNEGTEVSELFVTTFTNKRVSHMVMYANNNTLTQRAKQKVTFDVLCEGLETGPLSLQNAAFWTVVPDGERFSILTSFATGDGVKSFQLGFYGDEPMLSSAGRFFWKYVDGRLVTEDGRYLAYREDRLMLSDTDEGALLVYGMEGGVPTIAATLQSGVSYMFTTAGDERVVVVVADE